MQACTHTRRRILIADRQIEQGVPDKEALFDVCSGGRARERGQERLNHNEQPALSLGSSPLKALQEFRGQA